jgi:pyruvate,water dikinase
LTPIIEKKRGGKAQKLIYASAPGASTTNVPTSLAERTRCVLSNV